MTCETLNFKKWASSMTTKPSKEKWDLIDSTIRLLGYQSKLYIIPPKFIEGFDLCESYGETSYVFPKNTILYQRMESWKLDSRSFSPSFALPLLSAFPLRFPFNIYYNDCQMFRKGISYRFLHEIEKHDSSMKNNDNTKVNGAFCIFLW